MNIIRQLVDWMVTEVSTGNMGKAKKIHKIIIRIRRLKDER